MPHFRARYVGRDGRRRSVRLDAVDLGSLYDHIETSRKAFVVDIRRVEGRRDSLTRLRVAPAMLIAALDPLELMLSSGVRINMALRTVADCAPAGSARRLWTEMVRLVEETGSLAEAVRKFPRVFNPSMAGIVAAHEAAGRLAKGVRHIRDYTAQMQEIRREAVRGSAYPVIVCVAAFAAFLVLCLFTLPRFSRMLSEIGVTHVNRITTFFFAVSRAITGHPSLVPLILGVPPVLLWIARRPGLKPAFDAALLRMPVVRRAVEAIAMARICVTYRAVSESGIRVVESLEFCSAAAGNVVFSRGLNGVIAAVRDNASVGSGFERAGVFPPEVVLAVKSGEGSLAEVFGRLADHYAGEATHRVAMALRMLEPLMLLLVLAWVFGVALAVVLPVVEVVNEIR
ncbi:MAG TPA: type II secretion system F family protein [Opitutaceae bacterium]|jgi:type II secretory pathway component PulF